MLLALGAPALALQQQIAVVKTCHDLALVHHHAGAHRSLAQEALERRHHRTLDLALDHRPGAHPVFDVDQGDGEQEYHDERQRDPKGRPARVQQMAPEPPELVAHAPGEPAMQFDPGLDQRPEQASDGFEAAHLISTKGQARVALETQHADTLAPAQQRHRTDRAVRRKIPMRDRD